jgi:prevent-host-death family protein
MSDKMSYMAMRAVSVRELQQNLKQVLASVERGQVIEVTRHRRRVARLSPADEATPADPWPDLAARAARVFGNRMIVPGASDLLLDDRGDR